MFTMLCFKLSIQLIKRERGHKHNLSLALGNLQVVNSILDVSFQSIKVFNFILTFKELGLVVAINAKLILLLCKA